MLSDKINTALDTMEVTISDVAKAGGCTPSNLNRIKNGVRTPPMSSPTIRHLADGLMEIARKRHMMGELCSLCGARLLDSEDEEREKLIRWLYEDEPAYVRPYKKRNNAGSASVRQSLSRGNEFSSHLNDLIKLAGMSNRRLGKEAGLDQSYISRLRRGERIPRYRSPYLIQICEVLLNSIIKDGKIRDLSLLTSISEEDLFEKEGSDGLRRWLFGYGTVTGYLAAEELMGTIASIDEMIEKARTETSWEYDIDQMLEEAGKNNAGIECGNEWRYVGVDGIRSAVTRFLAEMLQNGEKEVLLYCDQSMDWMEGDFGLTLKALMIELIRSGVKIHIIHNVDRLMTELVTAVEWWMPLYLSGNISSSYCRRSAGKRFSHTLFIRPGKACIAGTSAVGLESRAVYHYSTDSETAGLAEDSFNSILKGSLPLVKMSEFGHDTPAEEGYVRTGKVLVRAAEDEVTIRRLDTPYLMFTFTHPMILRAFRSYMSSKQ